MQIHRVMYRESGRKGHEIRLVAIERDYFYQGEG